MWGRGGGVLKKKKVHNFGKRYNILIQKRFPEVSQLCKVKSQGSKFHVVRTLPTIRHVGHI